MAWLRTGVSRALYWGAYAACSRGFAAQVRRRVLARERLQWDSPDQVRARQVERLRRLLRHAVAHVPYYRRLHAQGLCPDHVDTPEELASVPPLTKAIITDDRQALVAENTDPRGLMERRSGGSTGDRLVFYVTAPAIVEASAGEVWGDSLAGYRLGDPVAVVWGSHFDPPQTGPLTARMHTYVRNRMTLISDRMDEAQLTGITDRCLTFGPRILIGYGNSLAELAAFLKRTGHTNPGFPNAGVIVTAEALSPDKKRLIGEVFARPVFDRYGSVEAGLIAMECDRHQGLHLNCEDLWVDLDPCPDGPEGAQRVLVTKLHEFGMPFIRYDLGDTLIGRMATCPCGRGYPTIEGVKGRQMATLWLPDGTAVSGHTLMTLLDCFPFRQYRVVQEADYSIRVEIVPDPGYDGTVPDRLRSQMQPMIRGQVPIEVRVCQNIQRTVSGKLLPVFSHAGRPAAARRSRA